MKTICTPTLTRITIFIKVLLLAGLLAYTQPAAATIRYVVAGATGSGTSWSNASSDLQAMINASQPGDEVWVAEGTYQAPASNVFIMKNSVKIYGGFAGSETSVAQRDLTQHTSKLQPSDLGVVIQNYYNGLNSTALLDGFYLTGATGGAILNWGSSPTFANCSISNNYGNADGGGVYNYQCSPVFMNCTFMNNTANNSRGGGVCDQGDINANSLYIGCSFISNSASNGGGISILGASPSLISCQFRGNSTPNYGGAVYINGNSPVLFINCLVSGNTAFSGGGIYSWQGPIALTNCTFSGNKAANSGAIYTTTTTGSIKNSIIYNNSSGIGGSFSTVTNSLVQGSTSTANGNISGAINPLFVSAPSPGLNTGGDYHLQPCSPVVNRGKNSYISQTTDLDGNARIYNVTVDMGAYEQQAVPVTVSAGGIVYVKQGGNGSGASWACPTGDLQAAINAAGSGNQVWVARGTYIPNRRADATGTITTGDRNDAFVLKSDVKIYGGFAGTESSLANRNLLLTANASILSGDLTGNDNGFNNNGENAYHVVVSSGDVSTAVLDGFTIQNGNCDGGGGGGIFCSNSSPTLNNLIIKSNAGRYGAGLCLSSSSPAVTNCTITANAGFYGGGVLGSNCGASFTNVLISGNTAVEQGGGMYNEFAVAPTLTNVTIAGNTANYASGAMYNNLGPALQMRNCIVYGNNTGIFNNNGSPSIQYSLVQGETSTANGNIANTDPLFINQLAAGLNTGGNYQLQVCSPAINAGNSILYSAGQTPDLATVTTDLNKATRIQGLAIDMGAYEFTGNPNCTILPLTLLNFTGRTNNGYNQLQWETADEVNTKQFVLERRTDGVAFTAIAAIAAAGNSNSTYSYKDLVSFTGKLYYRLQMVDVDGKYTYSTIVTLSNTGNSTISLYPNPASDVVYVNTGSKLLHSTAGLYDLSGRLLQNILITATTQPIPVQQLKNGVYILKLENGIVMKFIKR
jgi:hypothetical protein